MGWERAGKMKIIINWFHRGILFPPEMLVMGSGAQ